MAEFIAIGLLAALGWFWYDSMRAREAAIAIGKEVCRRDGVQFLDETVALANLGFTRDPRGHLTFRRTYRFEFSDTGNNRLKGSVVMMGTRLEILNLEPHGMELSAGHAETLH